LSFEKTKETLPFNIRTLVFLVEILERRRRESEIEEVEKSILNIGDRRVKIIVCAGAQNIK
jgi:hypothetical protein